MTLAYLTGDCARKLIGSNGGRQALNPLLVRVPVVVIKRTNLTSTLTINNYLKSLGV